MWCLCSYVVNPDPRGSGSAWIGIKLKVRIWIRIRILIKVISWIRIRIRISINLQITSLNISNICLFEHFFKVLSLYLEARIRIRIRIKVKGRIRIRICIRIKVTSRTRIRIKVIRNTAMFNNRFGVFFTHIPIPSFDAGIAADQILYFFSISPCCQSLFNWGYGSNF
jgi:hypothetical protein